MRAALSIPSLISVSRAALTPVIAAAILRDDHGTALLVFLAAAVTDVIDGWVARRFRLETRVGAYLDPVTDKILLSTIYVCLGLSGAAPMWFVVLVFARDIVILLMAGYGLLFTRLRSFSPSRWGKLSTFGQLSTGVAIMLAHATGAGWIHTASGWMTMGAAAMTGWSGAHYLWTGWRMLRASATGGAIQ